jgi:hypothetical protein
LFAERHFSPALGNVFFFGVKFFQREIARAATFPLPSADLFAERI